MSNSQTTARLSVPSRLIACVFAVMLCSIFSATAQLFPGANDTIKVSPWSWLYKSSTFYGFSHINTAGFNAVMEKNGFGRLANWQFNVGIGQAFSRGDWTVALYGYVGITPKESSTAENINASLLNWGLEEYISYTVLQNEQFRLFPQVGIHVNVHNYRASERNASIDATTLQAGALQAGIPTNKWSLNMATTSVGVSLGIGGDFRIPFPQKYKLDTNPESVYQSDLILGLQVAYHLGLGSSWAMDGARVSNLPGVTPSGLQVRLIVGSDLRLLK